MRIAATALALLFVGLAIGRVQAQRHGVALHLRDVDVSVAADLLMHIEGVRPRRALIIAGADGATRSGDVVGRNWTEATAALASMYGMARAEWHGATVLLPADAPTLAVHWLPMRGDRVIDMERIGDELADVGRDMSEILGVDIGGPLEGHVTMFVRNRNASEVLALVVAACGGELRRTGPRSVEVVSTPRCRRSAEPRLTIETRSCSFAEPHASIDALAVHGIGTRPGGRSVALVLSTAVHHVATVERGDFVGDDGWRVDSVTDTGVGLSHFPDGAQRTLALGAAPSPPLTP